MAATSFQIDAAYIEDGVRTSALAGRVRTGLPPGVPLHYVADGRAVSRELRGADPFGSGKRRLIVMRHPQPFLSACPAASAEFACCGYLVMTLASNCPMDCSYCFLQEHLAGNPGFELYANYGDAFDEIERLRARAPGRYFRIGTGEMADSLAFDRLTAMSRDLVEFFAARPGLTLELKTKTDEIDNLLAIDPKGATLVSWTLSPHRVFQSSEHRSASPAARIAAAQRVLQAGYRVGFHLDPIIAYEGAEREYLELLEALFDSIAPARISFVSMGGLRMTPGLRTAARRRFPSDPMLAGEEVLSADGRYRTYTPLRLRMFRTLSERIRRVAPELPHYLCMETAGATRHALGANPASPSQLGQRLAMR